MGPWQLIAPKKEKITGHVLPQVFYGPLEKGQVLFDIVEGSRGAKTFYFMKRGGAELFLAVRIGGQQHFWRDEKGGWTFFSRLKNGGLYFFWSLKCGGRALF